jgi:hypothetical protein
MANFKKVHCTDCCKEIKSTDATMIKRKNRKTEYYCDNCMQALKKLWGREADHAEKEKVLSR